MALSSPEATPNKRCHQATTSISSDPWDPANQVVVLLKVTVASRAILAIREGQAGPQILCRWEEARECPRATPARCPVTM